MWSGCGRDEVRRANIRACGATWKSGTEVSLDIQGDAMAVKRLVRALPDWRTMQGMAQGGKRSSTDAELALNSVTAISFTSSGYHPTGLPLFC